MLVIPSTLPAATFTTNALISEANTTFDGQVIIVSGATLTVDGPHAFKHMLSTKARHSLPGHVHCQ